MKLCTEIMWGLKGVYHVKMCDLFNTANKLGLLNNKTTSNLMEKNFCKTVNCFEKTGRHIKTT